MSLKVVTILILMSLSFIFSACGDPTDSDSQNPIPAPTSPPLVRALPVFRDYIDSEAEVLAHARVTRLRNGCAVSSVVLNEQVLHITEDDIPPEFVIRYRVIDEDLAHSVGVVAHSLLTQAELSCHSELMENVGNSDVIEVVETDEIDPAYDERGVSPAERMYINYLNDQVQDRLIPNYTRPDSIGSLLVNPDVASGELGLGNYNYDSIHFNALMTAIEQNNESALLDEIVSLAISFDANHAEARSGFIYAFIHLFVTKEFPSEGVRQSYFHFVLDCGSIR